VAFVGEAVFRIAAAGDQRHHLVAELARGDLVAERDHLAGDLEAGQVAGAGRHRIEAEPLQHVRAVDACGRDLDQDLVRPRPRHRPLLGHQHLRSAGLADRDGGHVRGQLVHDGESLRRRGGR